MAVADAKYLDWTEVPLTPGELVAERRGEQVELSWKASPGALRYEVQRSDDFKPWIGEGEVAAPKVEISAPLSKAHRSTFRVRARSANGASPWGNPAWIGQ